MELGLTGRTAVVTGASRGVGLATVRALCDEGVTVVGAARTITPELIATGAVPVAVDLSTADGTSALVEQALTELGGVDLLVNNAGGGEIDVRGFLELTDQHWQAQLDLNLFAALRVSRAALPSLVQRRGVIVNVSSIGAWQPGAPSLAYDVAKAALKALGKGLADEFAASGIRVNTVTPGPVRTAIWEGADSFGSALAQAADVPQAAFVDGIPKAMGMRTGRLIEPAEVAALITYLLSDRAASITGSDHLIDGGVIRAA